MPLYKNAGELIRANLEEISAGRRVKRVEIGDLSEDHVVQINKFRTAHGFPPITGRIVFIGKHIHKSRIVGDGYSVDEVLEQVESALQEGAELQLTETGTALQNPNKRPDRYGNLVRDRVVLECTSHHPFVQLWSAIPIGDTKKPPK